MRRAVLPILVVALGIVACGDDPAAPTIGRDEVAGTYVLTTLSFDPQGSLPDTDIRSRLETTQIPRLTVSGASDAFQLVFNNPDGTLQVVSGTYRLRQEGIRLSFQNETDAQRILLPRNAELTFNAASGTLSFTADTSVRLSRLRQLVPEFQNEPLSDPVPGRLRVVFTRGATL